MEGYRAAVVKQGVVQLEAFETPQLGPDDVLIKTRCSLISPGTERAFLLGLPNTAPTYPLYPGYSNIGEVIAVGERVSRWKPGDRVASPTAHASHVIVEASRCLAVPDGLSGEEASFFNLIAVAMQGVHKARIELGEPVAVIGMGLIGLFALLLARLNGGLPVIAIDQDPDRLETARKAGADAALTADDSLVPALREVCAAEGAAVVIEATGASSPILQAFQLAAVRGRVVLLGSARGETEGVNFYRDVHRKGLTIIGAHEITRPLHESSAGWWTQPDEHRIALNLLALKRLDVRPFISRRFNWRAFPEAYDVLAGWDRSVLGMIVDWEDAG